MLNKKTGNVGEAFAVKYLKEKEEYVNYMKNVAISENGG